MAQDLLAELHSRGIRLRLDGEKLDVLAPPGSLTPELRDRLRRQRDDLLALLNRSGPTAAARAIETDPAARHEPFPLTDIQHAYWVGRNPAVELGGVSTYMYLELESSHLEVDRLGESLRKVIGRHDMLRAVIGPDGQQRVLPEVPPYQLPVTDLRGRDEQVELDRIRIQMRQQVLPADRWPIFDIRATMLDGGRLRLHLGLDMLIMDGFSFNIFFREWRRFYQQPDWEPAPLSLTYRDYVLDQEASRSDPGYRRARQYWIDRLQSFPPAPELPLAAQPARLGQIEFVRRAARLPRERWDAIKQVAAGAGVTPSAVLVTAYSEVLRRWSGQPDLTLNLTLFDRPAVHPEIDGVIGDFTAVLLLAACAENGESFIDRAGRLHRQLVQDLEHRAYNGVRVLRDRSRALGGRLGPSMPMVFTSLLGVTSGETADGDVAFFGQPVTSISQTPQVWLDHQVLEDGGDLILNWDAVDALFPAGMLDDMFGYYQDLLRRLADDRQFWESPGVQVPLPQWQQAERDRANHTEQPLPARTLTELVEARAVSQPDEVAVIAGDTTLSYRELIERSGWLAQRLSGLGARRNRLIAVVLEKGIEQVIAVLGINRAGAAYLPIDPDWPSTRRLQLLERCDVRLVITEPRLAAELDWPAAVTVLTLGGTEPAAEQDPPPTPPDPADLAYVIFTSGSTGTPKGVVIDHRGAANTVQDINQRFGIGRGDRVLALSSLSFDLSVYDIFGTLAAGAAVVMPDPARQHDPAHWTELVQQHAVSVWNSVPALMQLWVDQQRDTGVERSGDLRVVMLSGDWIPVGLPDAIRAQHEGAQVYSLGGATEGSIWSVCYPIGEVPADWTRIPYGKPLTGQTLQVYDEELRPSPVWVSGEIYIGGTGVARGYWDDSIRTEERFIRHPRTGERLYRTGDYGRYLPGGDIEFLGRRDLQVKINGFRIELGEIAETLRRQPGVAEALVTAEVNPATGRRVLAAYVLPQDRSGRPDPRELQDRLARLLPEYLVPHHYLFIDRIPMSANGKVDPSALPAPWESDATSDRLAPRDELERVLHEVWCEALQRPDIGVEDNFFELGGDSLHAVRIMGELRNRLGIDDGEDALQRLFGNPSVAALATSLRDQAQLAR